MILIDNFNINGSQIKVDPLYNVDYCNSDFISFSIIDFKLIVD